MIRQQAFIGDERLLKGGLHCHTTRSDGKCSPEETIRLHKEHGYDFLALTDHNYYNYADYAPDAGVLIVPGAERDVKLTTQGVHVYHTVCIGPAKEAGNGYDQDQRFEGGKLVKNQAEFQPLLDDAHANGNLTIYCHPEWSATPACEFDQLKGNFAMEIWNSGCALENELDTNAACWDDLLLAGQRIYGVATDDGHHKNQHCNGWVYVRARRDLSDILNALKAGAFYSSCGPEIYDFYVDGEIAVMECSPCETAGFRHKLMPTHLSSEGHGLTTLENGRMRVEMKLPAWCTYVRGVVRDSQGRRAWTNPIFLK